MEVLTYCSRSSCRKLSCWYHINNAPVDTSITTMDRNDGCYRPIENQDTWLYCTRADCNKKECKFHIEHVSVCIDTEIIETAVDCYTGPMDKRKELLAAICKATKSTDGSCGTVCKAVCSSVGICNYCEELTESATDVEEEKVNNIGDF